MLSAWRASGCLPGLVTAEAHVGSGSDAQLGGAFVHGGIRDGLMLCQALAGVPSQQIGAPGRNMGEFSERGGFPRHEQQLLLRSRPQRNDALP